MFITSPMTVQGTLGIPFVYRPKAMGNPQPVFTVQQVPTGTAFVNGTVGGIPTVLGPGTIQLTATQGAVVDHRHVKVTIVRGTAVMAPTDLLVKGMTYPTYHTGEDISMTWTSDPAYYTVIKFFKLDGTQVLNVVVAPGIESFAIGNAQLVQALGTEQPFIVHAHGSNGTLESNTYVEAGVDFL
jgi:hypothetical protein